jgi:hypothetical protein
MSLADLLMANSSHYYRPGLFISPKEHDILHLVAHTWLIWHSLSNKKELREQKQLNRRPYLYNLRNTFYTIIELGSLVAWGSAAWRLMLS